jgi:hypothetical protein
MNCDLCKRELSVVDLTKDPSLCEDCHKIIFEQNDDPSEHIDRNTETCIVKDAKWWKASVVSLIGSICIGIIIAFILPRHGSDPLGIGFLVVIGIWILVGSLLCVIFASVSLLKKEKKSLWARAVAFPSFLILIFCFSVVIDNYVEHKQHETWTTNFKKYTQQIIANPEIVLIEHWDRSSDATKQTALRESFREPSVKYNLYQLKKMYDEAPNMRDYLFLHPACSKEFIEEHFDEAIKRCEQINYSMLGSMMQNPNTPIELIEQIAASNSLVMGAVGPARYALEKRKANKAMQADGAAAPRPDR